MSRVDPSIRLRIAPSPTGYVHVGNVRAALFNWLYAKHTGGTFIVRIDDTDLARSEPEFEEDIKQGLEWLGLDWQEGIGVGGPHGSYRQSDRTGRYREVADGFIATGLAYYDDREPAELEELRRRAQSENRHPNFYIRRPESPASRGAVRFSVPQDHAVQFIDLVRGDMRFEPEAIDDFVILRSDGNPTYHLASTVDDVDYRISHVARGEDLLSSTPKHILLTRAMGAEEATYAHMPLLFGPDGKKLSKRHGDTSLRAYRKGGYLPEAMINFMALLGWSLGNDRTIFDVDEAIAAFELSDVSKNPAVFDLDKLGWINGEYIRALDDDEFLMRVRSEIEMRLGHRPTDSEWKRVVAIAPEVKERTRLLTDVPDQMQFLLVGELSYDEDSWHKVMTKPEVGEVLRLAHEILYEAEPFDVPTIETGLRGMLEQLDIGARKGLQPLRVAVTGSSVSPPLFESMAALGKAMTLARLDGARRRLGAG